jgi:DNA adenine methylase
MSNIFTPFRYPGGKSKIAPMVRKTIKANNIKNVIFCEPFAGGAGVSIDLLMNGFVDEIILNDYDIAIYSVWQSIFYDTERLLSAIENVTIDINEWKKQKAIYSSLKNSSEYSFELAFATFFLNRTNVSGVITGGPIGGIDQMGKYKLDCRFNKKSLMDKISAIASKRDKITLYHMDASEFISSVLTKMDPSRLFVMFDPPYYKQGASLYKNAFQKEDHVRLSHSIRMMDSFFWILTYDDEPIIREIYSDFPQETFELQYSVRNKRVETELLIHGPKVVFKKEEPLSLF